MKKDFLPKTLNRTPDERACLNINVGRMSTELHYHDCVELIYVARGEVRVFFDNGWHDLACGSLLFVPPGCIHRCVSVDDNARQVVVGLTDDLICAEDSARKNLLGPYRTGSIRTGYLISGEACPNLCEMAERLCFAQSAIAPHAQLSFYADVLSLYSLIYGVWEREGLVKASRVESPMVCEMRKYVSENFSAKISACALAKRLNISYSYLAKIMSRELGTSFSGYMLAASNTRKSFFFPRGRALPRLAMNVAFPRQVRLSVTLEDLRGKRLLFFEAKRWKRCPICKML